MNKAMLKETWGTRYDTDQMVKDGCAMLRSAKHKYTEHGVCTMLRESFTNKANLLEMFEKSAHYAGNGRIIVQAEFDRKIDSNEVYNFFNDIADKLNLNHMLTFEDAKGKTMLDHLITGKRTLNLSELPDKKAQDNNANVIKSFDPHLGATEQTASKYNEVMKFCDRFKRMPYVTLSVDINIGKINAPMLLEGTKTARAFNSMCVHYGVDKLNPQTVTKEENGQKVTRTVYPYNKVFAKYSDLVSNLARKMYFVISINPLDYFAMSNGVSWKSCHNIVDGCYKGGTMSYMLDNTSIITYVVGDLDTPLHLAPRYYRQMIHYDNGMFMQNRLYPAANDGATDLYGKFRNLVIAEFNGLLGTEGEWLVDQGPEACTGHTISNGAHYKDYTHNRQCNIFYPATKRNMVMDRVMTIGHTGICPKCGRSYTSNSRLTHYDGDVSCFMEG